MRIPFWIKLALSMMLIMFITLAAGGYMGSRSFERGFVTYLNELQGERLEFLAEQLQTDYAIDLNWSFLGDNDDAWQEYVRDNLSPESDRDGRRPNQSDSNSRGGGGRDGMRSSGRGGGGGRDGGYEVRLLSRNLSVLDQNEAMIAGLPSQNNDSGLLTPLYNADDLIGYLRFRPFAELTESIDRSFVDQRKKSFLLIGVLSLIFTAFTSWIFSRYFRTIVLKLIDSAGKMAGGDYSQRIDIDRNDEIGQLAQSFNVLSHSLEKNQRARQQWIADISHELRTPLAVLRGELEALEDGVREVTPKAITSLTSEVHQLNNLVDDLYELSLSDIGALNYKMLATDPAEVLSTTFDSFRSRLESAELQFDMSCDEKQAKVLADDSRLTQLYTNLLENSVRYTDAGGKVMLKCEVIGKHWQMTLEDSSPAVTAEQLPNLFERFYRTDSSRGRDTGGAGLGLAIVSEIVAAHNGTIEASLSKLGGIKTVLRLPLNET